MEYNIQVWKSLRQPFRVPESVHRCRMPDWELIDCDVAGCTLCGRIHRCLDTVHCPTVADEGRHICQITGFYTNRNVFMDDEYLDTVANVTVQHVAVVRHIELGQIEGWVEQLLCSEDARSSIAQELAKREYRTRMTFVKLAKQAKANRSALNLVDLCTQTAHAMAAVRRPVLLDWSDAACLASLCSRHIDKFCRAFLDTLRCTPQSVKMHGFVVGLLYLMRTGLVLCGNIEVIPKVDDLALTLPSENHVKVVFKMSTKIMTEVENFIKFTVKPLSRDKLVEMGFRAV
jgi:hypothetical protein